MKKILDYYIIKKFLSSALAILFSFLIIFIAVDLIDNIEKFIDKDLSSYKILSYYLFTIPYYISIAIPMSVLIAAIFTFGSLQKNNELTAIKASGISIKRVGAPILILGIFFSISLFFFDNLIVSNYLDKRIEIDKEINSRTKKIYSTKRINNFYNYNIKKNQVIKIKKFNIINEIGNGVSILNFENSDLKSRIDIDRIKWDNEKRIWITNNYIERSWIYKEINYEKADQTRFIHLNGLTPEIIIDSSNQKIRPEEMNYWELDSKINKLKINNLNYNHYLVNKYYKIAFSCIPFIMILFGIALSIQKPRSGLALGVGLSLLVIFLYMVLIKFGQDFALSEVGLNYIDNKELVAFLSLWTVNFIFLILGGFLFFRART